MTIGRLRDEKVPAVTELHARILLGLDIQGGHIEIRPIPVILREQGNRRIGAR